MNSKPQGGVITLNIPKPLYLRIRAQVFKAEVESWDAVYGLPDEVTTPAQKYDHIHEQLLFYKKQNPGSNKIAKLLTRIEALRPN
jgi:hypothetical protein